MTAVRTYNTQAVEYRTSMIAMYVTPMVITCVWFVCSVTYLDDGPVVLLDDAQHQLLSRRLECRYWHLALQKKRHPYSSVQIYWPG